MLAAAAALSPVVCRLADNRSTRRRLCMACLRALEIEFPDGSIKRFCQASRKARLMEKYFLFHAKRGPCLISLPGKPTFYVG